MKAKKIYHCARIPMVATKDKFTKEKHVMFVCPVCGYRVIRILDKFTYNEEEDLYEILDMKEIEEKGE